MFLVFDLRAKKAEWICCQGGPFPFGCWVCLVASPGFAELLDELVLRMEVFPFQRLFFYYFLLFRFWLLLPKEILSFLNGQGKVPSPLDYFFVQNHRV